MKSKIWTMIGVLFLAGIFSGCGRNTGSSQKSQNSIQIKGSDTMVNLGQAWAEGFMQKHKDAFVAVTGGGSGTGIAALLRGTCDIAESSRQMKQKEYDEARKKGVEPFEIPWPWMESPWRLIPEIPSII